MKIAIVLAFLVAGITAITNPPITGTTPPPVACSDDMCGSRGDGNYRYNRNGVGKDNYFLQCVSGRAYCQACFPLSLKFKQECNQCMYSLSDPCYTTKTWATVPTFACPDECVAKGPDFRGNVADPNQAKHYVACWDGLLMGCVRCPGKLLFNEVENACLYQGLYITEPSA